MVLRGYPIFRCPFKSAKSSREAKTIVIPREAGLLLIHQYDHAALSSDIARCWRPPAGLPAALWPRFLEAVRRHDDGWREPELAPACDPQGRPYDFKGCPTAH